MQIIRTTDELLRLRKTYKNKSLGFVPTMGALHKGHLSLFTRAKKENDLVMLSIFVNPIQFNEEEDFIKYPRKYDLDKELCESVGVDYLFMPLDMYFEDEVLIKGPLISSHILDGRMRQGHFDGVLRIVMKLINITGANRVYFGKKDAQQLFLVRQMLRDFFMDVELVACDTLRTKEGLALSSRNERLSKEGLKKALLLYRTLKECEAMVLKGEDDVVKLKEYGGKALRDFKLEYFEVLTYDFKYLSKVKRGDSIILLALWLDGVRLIDNIYL